MAKIRKLITASAATVLSLGGGGAALAGSGLFGVEDNQIRGVEEGAPDGQEPEQISSELISEHTIQESNTDLGDNSLPKSQEPTEQPQSNHVAEPSVEHQSEVKQEGKANNEIPNSLPNTEEKKENGDTPNPKAKETSNTVTQNPAASGARVTRQADSRTHHGGGGGGSASGPKSPNYTFKAPSHKSMSKGNDESIFSGNTDYSGVISSPDFKKDASFHLDTHRCFRRLFPGARIPIMNEVTTVHRPAKFFPSLLLMHPPEKPAQGVPMGCTIMNLKYRKHHFLFRSELVLKNDRVGMVMWSGIRNIDGLFVHKLYLQFLYHLILLKRNPDNTWMTFSAFSWGTESEKDRSTLKSLTLKFPNGTSHTIRDDSDVMSSDSVQETGYAGVWSPNGGGQVPAMGLSSRPYYRDDNYYHPHFGDRTIDTTVLNGYGDGVDTFFFEQNRGAKGTWQWTRIIDNNRPHRAYIDRVVEAWYWPFRRKGSPWEDFWKVTTDPLKGTWTTMETYCSLNQQSDPTKQVNHLCYEDKSQ